MTPLAHQILKDSLQPKLKRRFIDPFDIAKKLSGGHCFEVSSVLELARTLIVTDDLRGGPPLTLTDGEVIPTCGNNAIERLKNVAARFCFLPSPVTWIEWDPKFKQKYRHGVLLDHSYSDDMISAFVACPEEATLAFSFDPSGDPSKTIMHGKGDSYGGPEWAAAVGIFFGMIISLLALINTPKIIGREQRAPHAGLQRAIARAAPGKYPLKAWTEIKLAITPTIIDESGPHQAYLTGAKALHFCRAHLRLRLGRLELVTAHWRGDPAVGLKRSRYKVING